MASPASACPQARSPRCAYAIAAPRTRRIGLNLSSHRACSCRGRDSRHGSYRRLLRSHAREPPCTATAQTSSVDFRFAAPLTPSASSSANRPQAWIPVLRQKTAPLPDRLQSPPRKQLLSCSRRTAGPSRHSDWSDHFGAGFRIGTLAAPVGGLCSLKRNSRHVVTSAQNRQRETGRNENRFHIRSPKPKRPPDTTVMDTDWELRRQDDTHNRFARAFGGIDRQARPS